MLGVFIFFVISGYIITRLLVAERQRTGDLSFAQFFLLASGFPHPSSIGGLPRRGVHSDPLRIIGVLAPVHSFSAYFHAELLSGLFHFSPSPLVFVCRGTVLPLVAIAAKATLRSKRHQTPIGSDLYSSVNKVELRASWRKRCRPVLALRIRCGWPRLRLSPGN
jgi:hypothetical protein